MNSYVYPASLLCDFYKVSHREQYPEGTTRVYSTWTARGSRVEGINHVVNFGLQGFIEKYLIEYFNVNFFSRPKAEVVREYIRFIKHTLGVENPDATHITQLHDYGRMPLHIKSVKEGTKVPLRVPMITIENTRDEFFWVTNYIETLMSSEIWMPSTSATLSNFLREKLDYWAEKTGGDKGFVPFQAHDFSARGMAGLDASASSGAGHLLSFVGTDTCSAIMYHEKYYNADIEKELVGTSIPATEHSVMCANGTDELASYKRLITEVYPKGFVSIVSDTWDFWNIVETVLPALRETILNRDGKVVIRPDSGNPVDILTGKADGETELERKGLIEALWNIFSGTINEKGFKVLDPHIGAIYGDSINLERAEEICLRLYKKGFASTNVVFGMGSYFFQYNTRDTFMFAMKATSAVINGEEVMLFKDPKTDSGMKKSQKGRVVVLKQADGEVVYKDGLTAEEVDLHRHLDMLHDVFYDGHLVREESLADIRKTLGTV